MNDPSFHFTSASDAHSERERMSLRQNQLREWVDTSLLNDLLQTHLDPELISKKNCENLIGTVEVPVGVAGPVTLHWASGTENILLPLATTEGALVASINRGAKAMTQSGGASVQIRKIGMSRAPVFRCENGFAAQSFLSWVDLNISRIAAACAETSQHLKYLNHQGWVRGRHVYIRFVFDTDEAMGMNMVTIALQHAWSTLQSEHPGVQLISLSSNACADKKDSSVNRLLGRGWWVQAEVLLTHKVLEQVLKTNADSLLQTHVAKNLVGSNVAGSLSQNMQVGNVVAAMYLATGQDLAHVTEGSQASITIELDEVGIYAAITLPNICVGTVGGGTWLPAQQQARSLIRRDQLVLSSHVAGAIGVAALAAEISGLAALTSNTLAQAHQKLGRIKSEVI